ncbi:MAG: hypothetical protein K2X87_06205 [Gemmataceae bacterium]|nr:hypothetical protein [Gemmataceae bacterium]
MPRDLTRVNTTPPAPPVWVPQSGPPATHLPFAPAPSPAPAADEDPPSAAGSVLLKLMLGVVALLVLLAVAGGVLALVATTQSRSSGRWQFRDDD